MISKHLLNLNIFFKLRILLKNYPFDENKIKVTQFEKLKKLLVFSYSNFDYYKEKFNKVGFNPVNFKHISEIQKIPVMSKEGYKTFVEHEIKKHPYRYKNYYIDSTSGSTGEPLEIYRTWDERAYMLAKYLRALFLNGYKLRDMTFGLPSPHRITGSDSIIQKFGFLRRQSVTYTEPVEKMVNGFIWSKADLLYANKSQLIQMAHYIRENHIKINKPRLINSSGEILDPHSKEIIESVFGRDRLFEVYGAVEFNNLAFQLTNENFFFFNHDTNLIELEDNDGNINSEQGKCIITDFNIFSFPLIRYKLNDRIEMEDHNGLGVITKITGRDDDWVKLPDGTNIPFHPFYEVMEKRSMVKQFKFVQEEIDLIEVFVVLENGVDRNIFKKDLIKELISEISDSLRYEVIFTDSIPADPGGKIRILISKIKKVNQETEQ